MYYKGKNVVGHSVFIKHIILYYYYISLSGFGVIMLFIGFMELYCLKNKWISNLFDYQIIKTFLITSILEN